MISSDTNKITVRIGNRPSIQLQQQGSAKAVGFAVDLTEAIVADDEEGSRKAKSLKLKWSTSRCRRRRIPMLVSGAYDLDGCGSTTNTAARGKEVADRPPVLAALSLRLATSLLAHVYWPKRSTAFGTMRI